MGVWRVAETVPVVSGGPTGWVVARPGVGTETDGTRGDRRPEREEERGNWWPLRYPR